MLHLFHALKSPLLPGMHMGKLVSLTGSAGSSTELLILLIAATEPNAG